MKCNCFYLLVLVFLPCCNNPDPVRPQTPRFYTRFDAGSGEQTAEFSLSENTPGGGEQAVELPGGVFYQGVSMDLRKIPAPAYRRSYNTAFSPEHRFSWKNARGETAVFDVKMSKIDSFWFDKTVLLKKQAATLQWAGGGLEKGETLVLMWENTGSGQSVPMELYAGGAPSAVVLPAAKMHELTPGDWSLYLVRKKLTRGLAGGMNAAGVAEYYTTAKKIRIQ